MREDSPTASGPSIPNSESVLMRRRLTRQRLCRAGALLPMTLFLPLMLLGMRHRCMPPEQALGAERAEHACRVQQDLRQAADHAAYWRAAARRSRGDARLALRARRWGAKSAWLTKRLAGLRR